MVCISRVPNKIVPKTPFELWIGRKLNLRHLDVWGFPTKVRIYNPQEKKLDSRTNSGFFIGYPEKSKGYRFYYPSHSTRIVETGNVIFIENGEISGSVKPRKVEIQKVKVEIPLPKTSSQVIVLIVVETFDNIKEQQINDETPQNEVVSNEPVTNETYEVVLKRSERQRRLIISDGYMVYL